jgi:AcrR family transcriptional regulator
VQPTTLAQIAEHADVPPGNVYYYFKTFDELVEAVIEHRQAMICDTLTRLDKHRTPKAKLKGLAQTWTDSADMVTESGCPLGSLVSELNKAHDQRTEHAAGLLRTAIDFIERQFRELGRRDAAALSVTMMARIQGAALLANTFGDPSLMKAEVRRIERWIDELA